MAANVTDVAWADDGIILYDGVCVLCSGWMRFVLDRDTGAIFRFTPIQSDYGRALAVAVGVDRDDPDTNAVVWGGKAWRRSDAAIRVVSLLPGWGWVKIFKMVPRPLRDLVYRAIARSRYFVFGRNAVCDVGAAKYADRVITRLG